MKMVIYKNKLQLINSTIKKNATVLDIGFHGQGVSFKDPNWPHRMIRDRTENLYGLDLDFNEDMIFKKENYMKGNAENFSFNKKFDIIFAGDLIEHLSNPGNFLETVKEHLEKNGKLVITTPNTFNLYNIIEKIFKNEPTVNKDHICYFNYKTIKVLLERYDLKIVEKSYLYRLDVTYKKSFFKRVQDLLYFFLSIFTTKYLETLVLVIKKNDN